MATVATDAQALVRSLTWDDCHARMVLLGIDQAKIKVYPVPRGGLCAATLLKHATVVHYPADCDVILDDVIDSGATRERYSGHGCATPEGPPPFVALVDKKEEGIKEWIRFPWEDEWSPESSVTRLLECIGEDPNREGLKQTPHRVVQALTEMTRGKDVDIEQLLSVQFESDTDQIVLCRGIDFVSLCEHHLMPFTGTVAIGYIPVKGRVVGLSKLPRLVSAFAMRLQIQEQMTQQIAETVRKYLTPHVAVVVKATHGCVSCRGVRQAGVELVTSCMLGSFREPEARAEMLSLLKE